MKKTKIIVPALGLLLLSTAASVTGTVAWFSANTQVNISGMAVKTKVSGNMLIADHNAPKEGEKVDSMYKAADLEQVKEGYLEPASSYNANNFYYTVKNIAGDGSVDTVNAPNANAFTAYNPVLHDNGTAADTSDDFYADDAFSIAYMGKDAEDESKPAADAFAYIDYEFYLKVTSTNDQDEVFISKCNLLYKGEALGKNDENEDVTDKAWRVAVFSEEIDDNSDSEHVRGSADELVTIMSLAGAKYFSESETVTDKKAVSGTSKDSYTAISTDVYNKPALIGIIDGEGTTQKFHVIVRLWLEGEDTTCTNETYAKLTDEYTLDLTCALDETGTNATKAVKNISSVKPTASV